ncbi:MAG: glycoside hydrolase family 3 N-terminal domain-containing protein, partial [Coriobacteriia bacterium]|nr:glycoside hydrolase family 3 N-terminal domain-containing protein [Coriobacteriia bacterium]
MDPENSEPLAEESEIDASSNSVKDKAQEILNAMTLEEKVGQMFIARKPEEKSAQKVAEYNLGGYILFERDFSAKTKDEVIHEIQSHQNNAKIPLFIGVDEEGGIVNRVSTNPNLRSAPFLSPQELFANGG